MHCCFRTARPLSFVDFRLNGRNLTRKNIKKRPFFVEKAIDWMVQQQPARLHEKKAKQTWALNFNIFCWFLLTTLGLALSGCPISEDIPPPICAFLFADNECSDAFYTVREDSQQMEIDELWNDRTTLAVIRPDCYLDLYDGANITDAHRFLGGETSEGNIYDLSWYAFANRTSSYICRCTGFMQI